MFNATTQASPSLPFCLMAIKGYPSLHDAITCACSVTLLSACAILLTIYITAYTRIFSTKETLYATQNGMVLAFNFAQKAWPIEGILCQIFQWMVHVLFEAAKHILLRQGGNIAHSTKYHIATAITVLCQYIAQCSLMCYIYIKYARDTKMGSCNYLQVLHQIGAANPPMAPCCLRVSVHIVFVIIPASNTWIWWCGSATCCICSTMSCEFSKCVAMIKNLKLRDVLQLHTWCCCFIVFFRKSGCLCCGASKIIFFSNGTIFNLPNLQSNDLACACLPHSRRHGCHCGHKSFQPILLVTTHYNCLHTAP